MGDGRDYRLIIPGSVFILFFLLTWLINAPSNLDKSATVQLVATQSFGDLGKAALAIVAVLVTGYSAGFLLSVPVVALFGLPSQFSHSRITDLKESFGIVDLDTREDLVIRSELVAEMSVRLHNHATDEFCSFLARRLSTMYVSFTCIVAIWSGILFSTLHQNHLGIDIPTQAQRHPFGAFLFFCSILTLSLIYNGVNARLEHWCSVCKFIQWDVLTHEFKLSKRLLDRNKTLHNSKSS